MKIRSWKFRLYPSGAQKKEMHRHLSTAKDLWNFLLAYTKECYEKTGKFPARKDIYSKAKETLLFSQAAQNVADRLAKCLRAVLLRKKSGKKAGFPRFKSIERMKSITYPQFGFRLGEKLEVSGIGAIQIKKHREIKGEIKTLTIKKFPSGKWFAIFTSEIDEVRTPKKEGRAVGMDLGIEHFAYLSDGMVIQNPKHLRASEENLKQLQQSLSRKKRGSRNRVKARLKVARAFEKLKGKRADFLHKMSRTLVEEYPAIAMENLAIESMARGFLAKSVLDCGWADFMSMLRYKAEEAGCEIVLVDPANTSQKCNSCGSLQKKTLAERWHSCACGVSMHRDLNAAMNILKRATSGTEGSQARREDASTHYKSNGQVSSMKQEATSL